jgi:hypothetical protein
VTSSFAAVAKVATGPLCGSGKSDKAASQRWQEWQEWQGCFAAVAKVTRVKEVKKKNSHCEPSLARRGNPHYL